MDSGASIAVHVKGTTPVKAPAAAGAPEMMMVESLPLETRCPPFPLRQYGGFWIPEPALRVDIPAIHSHFTPRPNDVILVSFPKSGTTWLKALAFATLKRAAHTPSDADHPLRRSSPHDCVKFLESGFTLAKSVDEFSDELEALPSPRLLATHLPCSLLPERVREACKIVSVCRDPKDTLVSGWLFTRKAAPAFGADVEAYTLQEAFDLFCNGRCLCGPQWQHVLQYWKESVSKPDRVLFLRYEEMLCEPHNNLKKLAKFMGCEFSSNEEEEGVVDAIVELCSIGTLKKIKVMCSNLPIQNAHIFRKGVSGDWSNYMTLDMAERLDKMVEDALQGSGFTFNDDSA